MANQAAVPGLAPQGWNSSQGGGWCQCHPLCPTWRSQSLAWHVALHSMEDDMFKASLLHSCCPASGDGCTCGANRSPLQPAGRPCMRYMRVARRCLLSPRSQPKWQTRTADKQLTASGAHKPTAPCMHACAPCMHACAPITAACTGHLLASATTLDRACMHSCCHCCSCLSSHPLLSYSHQCLPAYAAAHACIPT